MSAHIPQLHLEEGSLHKQSYVKLKHIYQVDASKLHKFSWRRSRAYELRLEKQSYVTLMHCFKFEVGRWQDTDTISQTAEGRFDALAHLHCYRAQHESQGQPVRIPSMPNPQTLTPVMLEYYCQPRVSTHYPRSHAANWDEHSRSFTQNPVDAWPWYVQDYYGIRPSQSGDGFNLYDPSEETKAPNMGWLQALFYLVIFILLLYLLAPILVMIVFTPWWLGILGILL